MKNVFKAKLSLIVIVVAAGLFLMSSYPCFADDAFDPYTETKEEYDKRVQWFRDAKFGVMLCWNPSSLIGQEIGWSRAGYGPEKYDQLYKQFTGEKFNADQWVKLFDESGIRYSNYIPKHHDGFVMWDTETQDYNVMNTPFGRDWVKELAEAHKGSKVNFGLYYSICDWWNPAYSNQAGADLTEYRKIMKKHLEELLTNYGPIGTVWWDGNWEGSMTHELGRDLYAHVRRLQPATLHGNRIDAVPGSDGPYCSKAGSFNDAPDAVGDYQAREHVLGKFYMEKAWDRCVTLNNQGWAWVPPANPRPLSELLSWLIEIIGRDGNMLLGVGPRPDGTVHPLLAKRMLEMGDWLKLNGEAVYGTRGGPYLPNHQVVSTRKGKKVFVFVKSWYGNSVVLPALPGTIQSARVISGGSVTVETKADTWEITVPEVSHRSVATIVELTLDQDAMKMDTLEIPEPVAISTGKPITVSGEWTGRELSKLHANDGNFSTIWGAPDGSRKGWLEIDLGQDEEVSGVVLDDSPFNRTRKFEVKAKVAGQWKTIAAGTTIGVRKYIEFDKVKARIFRLEILEASDVPVIREFQLIE